MRIINIIDNLEKVNFGIWNAAIATAQFLNEEYDVESHLWFPSINQIPEIPFVTLKAFESLTFTNAQKALKQGNFHIKDTIIVTHGCWQFPTKWGSKIQKLGYKWIMVPHGMLEPWSLQQKWLKKKIYFNIIENRLMQKADAIRAVGSPELKNLKKIKGITPILIPNGIPAIVNAAISDAKSKQRNYLFMARLHAKKGVLPMVTAWHDSILANNENYTLTIAGPDDGELQLLISYIKTNNLKNIKYVGAVYDNAKEELLKQSHFEILPSFSEGFPTSLLEAMQYGLIPLMTEGCNFPEAIEQKLAIEITPLANDIKQGLEASTKLSYNEYSELSVKAALFVTNNYGLNDIATKQFKLYKELLSL
jgi:hypothetical protein